MKKLLMTALVGLALLSSNGSTISYAQESQACNIATLSVLSESAKTQELKVRDLTKAEEAKVMAILGPPPVKNFEKYTIIYNEQFVRILVVDNTGCVQLTTGVIEANSFWAGLGQAKS